jgi:uncharacterized protein
VTSKAALVAQVETWARDLLERDGSVAHGWLHVDRVRRLALVLAPREGVAPWKAECAALLHDVGRAVPGPQAEHGRRSAELAAPLLSELPLTEAERSEILHAVRWHNTGRDDTRLLCVLRDADMLDGMGAIGLLRAYTSKAGLPPYGDPESLSKGRYQRPPRTIADQIAFQMDWIGFLNTDTARTLAQGRLAFMRAFVAQLRRELAWDE